MDVTETGQRDFGATLRVARERRGISLRQIADSTRISIAALEALEANDVSRLPGGIFTRSFVRLHPRSAWTPRRRCVSSWPSFRPLASTRAARSPAIMRSTIGTPANR